MGSVFGERDGSSSGSNVARREFAPKKPPWINVSDGETREDTMTQEELNDHLEGLLNQVKDLHIRAQNIRQEIRDYTESMLNDRT